MTDTEKYSEQIKQALSAIKNLKAQLTIERNKHSEPIAIIGMAMHLPGNVKNADDLWKLLINNIDAIEDIPQSRFDNSKIYDEQGGVGKNILKQGGYLKDIEVFDAPFFDLTRIETESLDPQQRLLLELTQEALENSGINTAELVDSETGVFVGITSIDYQKKHFRCGDYNLVNPYSYTGSAVCANAGRISYTFGFQGPSVSIDTACSSSLVATHLAVQSLRKRESDMAIVGAANLILEPELSICFTALNGLSRDSRCRPFADNANGFVRSEGAVVIVLKRLSDAEQNKDNILAVIKGSAVNQDGKSNGFTAPSVSAQTKLIQAALKDAGLNPDAIDYVEAHGTGTKIGDPIELEALANVFGNNSNKKVNLASIKSNIGHTESVAGLAGLVKNVLALNHQILPKNLHSDTLNSLVDWESLPVQVVQENQSNSIQNVGVSSFGVTGTNAHVVVQKYDAVLKEHNAVRTDIFVLPISAKSEQALVELIKKYLQFIQEGKHTLQDICAMAALRRADFKYRKVFVAVDEQELIQQMHDTIELGVQDQTTIFDNDDFVKTIFVFPGQGAQWLGMAQNLIVQETVFKASLEAFNNELSTYVSWNLFDVLNGDNEQFLNQLDVVQPILVAIGIALADLWKSKDIFPNGVIGHSLGEVAAAYVAENISLHDAVKIICKRSKLMKQVSGKGLMLATDLTFSEAKKRIENLQDKLSIAVVNSEQSLVLSGDSESIWHLQSTLEQEGKFARMIKVDVASHSIHMDKIDEELAIALDSVQPINSNIAFYSTVYGKKIDGSSLDANYWKNNLRQTVRFKDSVEQIIEQQKCVFIEMSPHPTLLHALQQNFDMQSSKSIALPSFLRDKNDFESFYKNYGALYETNYTINWKNIYPEIGKFVQLPNYAWQKERYWFDEQPNLSSTKSTTLPEILNNNLPSFEIVYESINMDSIALKQQNILLLNGEGVSFLQEILEQENNVKVQQIHQSDFSKDIDIVVFNLLGTTISKLQAITILQNLVRFYDNETKRPKIILLSNGANVLDGDKQLNTTASIVQGIVQSLHNEYLDIDFRTIDLPFDWKQDDIKTAIHLFNTPAQNKSIALRNGLVYQPKLQIFKAKLPNKNYFFNKEQTVLIIGGTSGLGLELAKWLSTKGVNNIALVSRSGLKDKTQEAIEFMKQNNTKVAVLKADFSNFVEAKTCISTIETAMPKVQTIVHAAAVLGDALFQDIDRQSIQIILNSKVEIAQNIDALCQDRLQSKVIFFSSAASILGTLAQAVYSGANYYLDNLAKHRMQVGLDTIAVNWGNIGTIGLAAQDTKRGANLKEQGLDLIMPNELPKYFEEFFSVEAAQFIPLKIDFTLWKKYYNNVKNNLFYTQFVEQDKTQFVEQLPQEKPSILSIKENIKQHIAQITKIPSSKIKEEDTFKSIGIDSLMALQLKNKIQVDYQLNLNIASVWSHPTVEKYANFIAEELNLFEKETERIEVAEISKDNKSIEAEVDDLSLEELMKQLNEKI
ncbi:MAG: SDR family NAD(P)-dependent oxidoreductase [Chitinophagales bacterium]